MPRSGAWGVHGTIGSGAGTTVARGTQAATAIAMPSIAAAARPNLRQAFELAERNAVIGLAGERAFERVPRGVFVTQLQ
jgi:hypothetical protein